MLRFYLFALRALMGSIIPLQPLQWPQTARASRQTTFNVGQTRALTPSLGIHHTACMAMRMVGAGYKGIKRIRAAQATRRLCCTFAATGRRAQ